MNITPLHDESELLAKIAGGDEHAFHIIYNRYYKKIYHFSLRILNSQILAEDVMQETMLKLWLLGEGLHHIVSLESFLRTVSRNKSFDVLRRIKFQDQATQKLGENWSEMTNETEEQVILNDARQILQQAITLLPEYQRRVYELCHIQGLKHEVVADLLNLSVLSVRTYMKRALFFLRNYVRKHIEIIILLVILKLF